MDNNSKHIKEFVEEFKELVKEFKAFRTSMAIHMFTIIMALSFLLVATCAGQQ